MLLVGRCREGSRNPSTKWVFLIWDNFAAAQMWTELLAMGLHRVWGGYLLGITHELLRECWDRG